MNELKTTIGKRLRMARDSMNLTQKDVENRLPSRPSVGSISNYEKDVNVPKYYVLEELCELYGVTADWVLFGKGSRSKRKPTMADNLREFVRVTDLLDLPIECITDARQGTNIAVTLIPSRRFLPQATAPAWEAHEIEQENYLHFTKFFNQWCKYRNLLADGDIDHDEYQALLDSRLEEAVSVLTNLPTDQYIEVDDDFPPF